MVSAPDPSIPSVSSVVHCRPLSSIARARSAPKHALALAPVSPFPLPRPRPRPPRPDVSAERKAETKYKKKKKKISPCAFIPVFSAAVCVLARALVGSLPAEPHLQPSSEPAPSRGGQSHESAVVCPSPAPSASASASALASALTPSRPRCSFDLVQSRLISFDLV